MRTLVPCLLLALAACGGSAGSGPETASAPDSETVPDAGTDAAAWCLPYGEVDAPPGSGSLPDPVPGRTCHAETSGNLIYWCCVSE